jgi:short-subunit dehydrogenase
MLALVTGASSGIGYELAAELARRGYDLVVAAAGERLGPAAEHFRTYGHRVTEARVDLAITDGVEELWRQVEAQGAPLEVACINAGVGLGGLFWETDLDKEINMVNLNCTGAVHLSKYIVRQMVRRGTGRILFTSSIAGEMVAPREAVYAATKAFVLSFAHSLRYELKDTGVTVTALQPGPTDTDFFHRAEMDDTKVGQEGKKESDPADVARQGIDALFDGKDHIYAASLKTKIEGKLANAIPGAMKGAMHEKQARPVNEK